MTALAAFALALRVACAAATEIAPIFPSYYYTDAAVIHAGALGALADIRAARAPLIQGTLAERVQILISLGIYRGFGARPFAVKLFNAFLGALAVGAFAWALSLAFPDRSAFAAGFAVAVWPSHVFYTSQNLKEAPVSLLVYAALGSALAAGFDASAPRPRAAAFALGAGLALLGAGFYRSYVLLCLAASLLTALGLAAARAPRMNAALAAVSIFAALGLYPCASRGLLASISSGAPNAADAVQSHSPLMPAPTSPEGISRFRASRQAADRVWASDKANREIGTQIYPGEKFRTWLDVLSYLPKGAFTVLFMPLPGLYPLEGKLGRWAAAAENGALLLLALLAAAGFARGPKTPQRLGLVVFFGAMTAGAALLEFDLGSAGRHKLLYLPMLFPFAAEEALRLLRGEEPA